MLDIQDPIEARKVIRENKYTKQTAGTAESNAGCSPAREATIEVASVRAEL